MTGPSRPVARAARRLAEQQSDRFADVPASRRVVVSITAVTAGGAADGNALVKVKWRDKELTCKGYNRSYTPVVGHRVVCDVIDDQLLIAYSPVGNP